MYKGIARGKPAFCKAGYRLFNMHVIGNMVFAVAVVALAPGAVAEFKLREFGIGSAADGAAVGVGGAGPGRSGFAVRSGEGDNLRTVTGLCRVASVLPLQLDPPGKGEQIAHIRAEEQEVIEQTDQREQTVGEEHEGIAHIEHTDADEQQVNQCQNPGFHRNHEHDQKLCIGIHGG